MDKATKVMSTEYDLIYVQEAIELTENDWESLTTRLRNGVVSFQQLIADTNPSHPTHWLKQRCNKGTTVMLDSRHEENPRFFNEDGSTTVEGADYMSKLDNLAGVRKARLRDGKWVAAEGLIYEEWDSTVHLVDWFRIPQDWTRYWAVDFGYTNPFVLQWWAEDPDGRLFMYREIYHTKRTVDQHARQALQLVTDDRGEWLEPTPRAIVCDHDAEGRVVFQRELGLGTLAANKKVTQGIQAFQKRLKERRVFIMRNAVAEVDQELREAKKPVCTEEEIVGYTWATKPGGDLKEEPHKEDDHGCDAARYVVAHRDLRGVPDIRWL
jgi:phage terminase large subunit